MATDVGSNSDFVALDFNVDAGQLADDAIEALRGTWSDWEPNDGDLEVIQIEELAPMAAAVAEVAANMPAAALRAFAQKCLGMTYEAGVSASTTVSLTFVDNAGYTVLAGSQLEIDGFAFQINSDAVIAAGSTTLTGVPVSAVDPGSDANALTGALTSSLTVPPFVISIAVESPTAGGTDEEGDDAFTARISRDLQLRAKSLVTTRDFELEALDQQGIGRAHAVGDTARAVTVTITDSNGETVATGIKTALQADYNLYRLVNTTFTIVDPSYCIVNVTWVVTAQPGIDPADLLSRINVMLAATLTPAVWGVPPLGNPTTGWVNDTVVRVNVLIGLISDIQGVQYVESVTLSSPTSGATVGGSGDLTMPGTVPLPRNGTFAGTVH
jgi:hypothetical protein